MSTAGPVADHDARVTAPEAAVTEAAESAAPRFVATLALIYPAGLLVQALAGAGGYVHPVVAVVVWLGILVVAAWLIPRALAGDLGPVEVAAAVLAALAAIIVAGLDRQVHATGVNWTILGTVWLLALVALSTPARWWLPGSVLVLAVHAGFVVHSLGMSQPGLSRVAASAYAMGIVLAVFAALRPTLRAHAEIAVRQAALANRSAAERAAVTAILSDRRERFALLEMEALPLLRGIADGTLDPADCAVREKCAQHAATLRNALVERLAPGGELLAGLAPALSAARARQVLPEVQVIGDPCRPPAGVVAATLAAVDAVLRALPPQPVVLTVLAAEEEVELYLTFTRPPAGGADVAGLTATPVSAAWRAAMETEDTGHGCLTVRWRKAVAA